MTTTTDNKTLQTLKPGDLKILAAVKGEPCVSIFMPTHRSGRETQQGSIRLKNLLDEATDKLKESGHDDDMLQGLHNKLQDSTFWNHQGEGLAIFATTQEYQCYQLNEAVREQVVVMDSFHLQPLLNLPAQREAYFVLSLTWDDARLYRGSSSGLELVETEDLPAKFTDLVLPRDPEVQLQFSSHQARGNRAATQTAMFHGHGEGEDKIEADRRNFLTRAGDLVSSEVYNTGMPLVLIATQEVAGHFEAATDLEIAAKVAGSPAQWSETELASRADEAIQPQLSRERVEFSERFGTALAQKQASAEVTDVVIAAIQGRVDSLLVAEDAEAWGTIDPSGTQATQSDREAADVNLLSRAITETLRNGGSVFKSATR